MRQNSTPNFQLGEVSVYPSTSEIRIPGEARSEIYPRPMQVLVYLARNRGEIVPESKLLDEMYEPGETVVPGAVPAAIRHLRNAFGREDSGFIETVVAEGYRLNLSVSWQSLEFGEHSEFNVQIIWDTDEVDPEDYARLEAALGDLVRAEGGLGVKRIKTDFQHAKIPVGVPVL